MVCQDLPDYTRKMIIEYTGGFMGLEELAVRLGSIVPWDMRGNVVFMEDFETEETEWDKTEVKAGDSVTRQTRRKWSGNWAMKMVTSDVNNAETRLYRDIAHPGDTKVAIFSRIAFDRDLRDLRFGFLEHKGVPLNRFFLRYQLQTTELSIHIEPDIWEVIDDSLNFEPTTYIWLPICLTVNLETSKYDKLRMGSHEYDISAYGPDIGVINRTPLLRPYVYNHEIDDVGATIYVDDIVLVKNVP
ncbi:hypothetical protein ES703_125927 [subsurface metagenome]